MTLSTIEPDDPSTVNDDTGDNVVPAIIVDDEESGGTSYPDNWMEPKDVNPVHEITVGHERDRLFAKSETHLLTHTPHNPLALLCCAFYT